MNRTLNLLGFFALGLLAACSKEGNSDFDSTNRNSNNTNTNTNTNTGTPAPTGYDSRPPNPTCVAPSRPSGAGALTLDRAEFGDLSDLGVLTDLERGVINRTSDARQWIGARQTGQVVTWNEGHSGAVSELLNAGDLTDFQSGGERGLLGLAIDPEFPTNEAPQTIRIYLYYTRDCGPNLCSALVRRDLTLGADGASVSSLGVEETLMLLRQPASNHNGGALIFGPDGFLYLSTGDGGSGDDPWCNGQNLSTPLGKVLRIDVHSVATGYAIPASNPFSTVSSLCSTFDVDFNGGSPQLGRSEACPEIFAFGLRNPFRMSIDVDGSALWIGDVGQDAVEEVSTIPINVDQPRYNLGWPLREGDVAGASNPACDALAAARGALDTSFVEPRMVMRQAGTARTSVVGGYVYRGSDLGPAYFGRYFCGDYGSSEVWALADPYVENTRDVDSALGASELLGNLESHIGWAEDDDGELVLLTLSGPKRLVLASPTVDEFPRRLSEVGCFEPNDPREVVAGVVPYAPVATLWSDGAEKQRYFAIPDATTIDRLAFCGDLDAAACETQGDWEFPIGSVLIKSFLLDGTFLETRLFVRHDDGDWGGYSYRWNEEQTDATLIDGRQTRTIGAQTWSFPGRGDCFRCHTAAAGITLGLETRQLAESVTYPTGRLSPQLDTLDAVGFLEPPLSGGEPDFFPKPGVGSDPEGEARAYLHSNCSMCHRPSGGAGGAAMDLRFERSLAETGACGTAPVSRTWPELTDPALIKPGDSSNSVIPVRMRAEPGGKRMPPLATEIPDDIGASAVEAWIDSLSVCP